MINKEAFVEFETKEFSETNEKERAEEKLKKSRADIFRFKLFIIQKIQALVCLVESSKNVNSIER